MSSYKGHSLFALILSVLFFSNPVLIALTVIGANLPDFDHNFKKDYVYNMIIAGVFVAILLHILKLPYFLGLIIIFLGFCFYFSQHRSFTHSIFGVLILTACLSLIVILSFQLIVDVTLINDVYLVLAILVALLSLVFINRKLLVVFLPLFFVSVLIFRNIPFSFFELVFAIFLGLFSHIVLDSFTPSGIKIFAPLSRRKVRKNFGLVMSVILVLCAFVFRFYGNFFLFFYP